LVRLNVAHLMPPGTRPSQALNADGVDESMRMLAIDGVRR
jgi:hypothetical protein